MRDLFWNCFRYIIDDDRYENAQHVIVICICGILSEYIKTCRGGLFTKKLISDFLLELFKPNFSFSRARELRRNIKKLNAAIIERKKEIT